MERILQIGIRVIFLTILIDAHPSFDVIFTHVGLPTRERDDGFVNGLHWETRLRNLFACKSIWYGGG